MLNLKRSFNNLFYSYSLEKVDIYIFFFALKLASPYYFSLLAPVDIPVLSFGILVPLISLAENDLKYYLRFLITFWVDARIKRINGIKVFRYEFTWSTLWSTYLYIEYKFKHFTYWDGKIWPSRFIDYQHINKYKRYVEIAKDYVKVLLAHYARNDCKFKIKSNANELFSEECLDCNRMNKLCNGVQSMYTGSNRNRNLIHYSNSNIT